MKTVKISALFIAGLVMISACNKGSDQHHTGDHKDHKSSEHSGKSEHHMGAMTKVVKHGGYQFSLDLMNKQKHTEMMKMMKITMEHKSDSDRFISLSIFNQSTKKLVTDAKVDLTITGPDGKVIQMKAALMQGQGMSHYMGEFKSSGKGAYRVKLSTVLDGKKHGHQVEFQIK